MPILEKVNRVKVVFDTVNYSKKWWKKLVKDLKALKISNDDRIIVYLKICQGLIIESLKLSDSDESTIYIYEFLKKLADLEVVKNAESE